MSKTILVVDDNSTPREVAAEYVQALGHEALTAKHAKEALEILRDNPGKVFAVVTDMEMPPYMHGGDLGREIAKLYPEIRVLYTSGSSKTHLVREGWLAEDAPFLPKPLELAAFKDALTRIVTPSS